MIKFNEASIEELSEKFPQMPNRRLTINNSLEDIHEAKEILIQIKKQESCIFTRERKYKK